MNRLRELLGNLQQKESLRAFKPVLGAVESFLFGSPELTTAPPHILSTLDTRRYMLMVVLALIPTTLASVYFYGWRAVVMILVSYLAAGITEMLFAIFRQRKMQLGALAVTGLMFPLVLPPTLPLWMVALGSVFGIVFGKEVFGGTGRNIFNPALVGRIFLTAAFPNFMSAMWQKPLAGGLAGFLRYQADFVTAATPLISHRAGEAVTHSYFQLLFGEVPGSLGETFRLGIIIGGIFLMIIKVADWRIPVSFLGSVVVFSAVGHYFLPGQIAPPLFQLLTGALLFTALFMATDPVTSPFTGAGKWFFGIMLGFLTIIFRAFSGYVEGAAFGLLMANALAPLLDTVVLKVGFSTSKKKGLSGNV
ncbi:MAG TPA: RnfABCDGE type electron transport complex subunit D [Firmicutes bacterium]|nr:RnfABCDGE type electron transport complex subunit D [Bacillota bacterium]